MDQNSSASNTSEPRDKGKVQRQDSREELDRAKTLNCPFCPCEFGTFLDYGSHLKWFGYDAKEHLRLFQEVHKKLEYGILQD